MCPQQKSRGLLTKIVFLFALILLSQSQVFAGNATPFTRNLKLSSTGDDVLALQKYLNSHNSAISTIGSGSPGQETTYFGPKTKRALSQFQNAHPKEILTPAGIAAGTGNFFDITRNYVNSTLTNTSTTTLITQNIILPFIKAGNILGGRNVANTIPDNSVTPTITFNDASGTYSTGSYPSLITTVSAHSNSSGAITYFLMSGDPSHFSVNPTTGQVYVLQSGVHGTISIGAEQLTSGIYTAAEVINHVLVSIPPTITFNNFSVTFDGNEVTIPLSSDSDGTIAYTSGNTNVATIDGDKVAIESHGTVTISYTQAASNSGYLGATGSATLTVSSSCEDNLCSGYGTCAMGTEGGFSCSCDAGMTGSTCSLAIDGCASNPCSINGICTRTSTYEGPGAPLNSYMCSCQNGYYGDSCQYIDTSENACLSNPCQNGGSCSRESSTPPYGPLDSYSCSCGEGYFGNDCQYTDGQDPDVGMDNIVEYYFGTPHSITLTPSSLSSGAFSFGSSDLAVGSISGNSCTINGVGASTITVNQTAAGGFGTGHTTATLNVYDNMCEPENPCGDWGTCSPDGESFTCECDPCFLGDTCQIFDVINCA
ncbi:MAG: peptidoglycan-binding protein [Patescibacteria group bacterium]